MEEKDFIETKIQKALDSLALIEPANPSTYFYSKVLLRLQHPKQTMVDRWNSWILTPSLGFATLFLILLINAIVILRNVNDFKGSDQNTVALAEEYNQSTDLSFYLENPKP